MIFTLKIALANAAGKLARRLGRGGTTLPGKVLLRLEPKAIARLSSRLPQGSVVVSATNGKTTTATMIAAILEEKGVKLVHNHAGANMAGGIATTLASSTTLHGRKIDGECGLFEVDEFWLPTLVNDLQPKVLLLGNLFRDQLDRYGELETIVQRWTDVVAKSGQSTQLVLNSDDPTVSDLANEVDQAAKKPIYFGINDHTVATNTMQHASDSKHCRRCGSSYTYNAVYLAHLGDYACQQCGAERPTPDIVAEQIELHGVTSSSFTLRTPAGVTTIALPLPGIYNIYNALGAAATCYSLGASLDDISAGLKAVKPAFGRAETVTINNRSASILLIKNPAGANEVLRTLTLAGKKLNLFGILNDRTADGRDISWIWDVDWELIADHIDEMVCSGTRAEELALRIHYAGVSKDRLTVIPDISKGFDTATSTVGNISRSVKTASANNGEVFAASTAIDTGCDNPQGLVTNVNGANGSDSSPLYVLPTYTGLLELRTLLSSRGNAGAYWEKK